jgi:acetyl esterase/lipase
MRVVEGVGRVRWARWLALAAVVVVLGAVTFEPLKYRLAIWLWYRHVDRPAALIVRDVAYRSGSGSDPIKHRLDLFLADGANWPVVVFVHGGGWRNGDRAVRIGGADIYSNIGRYLAARGIGAAVISYRLQPAVGWRAQVSDAAHAVAWVRVHIAEYGGDPDRLFLMGHSAGAQLVTCVTTDREAQSEAGLPPEAIKGVIAASGAGYDLADEETYRLGADPSYYEDRFAGPGDWRKTASVARLIAPGVPPFLILFATGESLALQHQAKVLDVAVRRAGGSTTLVPIEGESHERMTLCLSRDDKGAGPAIVRFVLSARTTRAAKTPSTE